MNAEKIPKKFLKIKRPRGTVISRWEQWARSVVTRKKAGRGR
jgi:hypothetical protein